MPGVKLQDIHELLAQQDQKYQAMLSQVMQHMMSMQQQPVLTAGPMQFDLTSMDVPMEQGSNSQSSFSVGNHGWTQAEVDDQLQDFSQMTSQELSDFNFQELALRKGDEEDLLKGPFYN